MTPAPVPDRRWEQRFLSDGFRPLVGVDEAGRGPLAGPVVAAAVVLEEDQFDNPIRDSKTLSARQRERAFEEIGQKADIGVGIVNEMVIDAINILRATVLAMERAVWDLVHRRQRNGRSVRKPLLLVDGHRFDSDLPFAVRCLVRGESQSVSIAAASIVAKVVRDRILHVYDRVYPEYGFASNKGYPTADHMQAIRRHGLSRIHRRSFHPRALDETAA